MTNNNEKLNNSCLKIFKFLNLLYENRAYYDDVKDIFKDDLGEQSDNNLQVVLNKYINTLRVFGMKITKKNNKFILESSLYSMDFDNSDLESINILINAIKTFPDENCVNDLNNLMNALQLRMSNDDKSILNNIVNNYNFSFYYKDLQEQIDICKKICAQSCWIELTYKKNKKSIKCKCAPKEILYDTKTVYLCVYDIEKHSKLKIALPNILNIKELPLVSSHQNISTTVVFKLKGKLAKIYKMRPHEYLRDTESDGSIVIVNKDEPFDDLIARLMRYSSLCEIISPKFMRDKMIETINEALNKYTEEN